MPQIDPKSIDAVVVGIFKDAQVQPEVESGDAYGYAINALLDSEWEREAFGTDLSMYVDAAFSLGLTLAIHAVSDPLHIDYNETGAAIARAREQLDDFRRENADIMTQNGLRWLKNGRVGWERGNADADVREPEPVA